MSHNPFEHAECKEWRNIQCTSNAVKICLVFSYGSSADIFLPMRGTNCSSGTPFRETEREEKECWVYYKALVWSACSSFTWQSSESTVFKEVISFSLACRVVIFSQSAVIEMKRVGWGVLDSILKKHKYTEGVWRGDLGGLHWQWWLRNWGIKLYWEKHKLIKRSKDRCDGSTALRVMPKHML